VAVRSKIELEFGNDMSFEERGKQGYPEKNLSEQSGEPATIEPGNTLVGGSSALTTAPSQLPQ